MKRPPVRPLLGAAAGLVICTGSAPAAAAPAAEPAAPAARPGWVSRVAAESKKLAFWDKDRKEAAPVPPPKPEVAPAGAAKKRGAAGTGQPATKAKPQAAPKKKAAAAPAAPPPPEPAPEKKSLFSKLPSLPFLGKSEPAAAPDPAPEPATAKKNGRPAAEGRPTEAKPTDLAGSPPPPDEKKPGFFDLGRLLPGGRKAAPDQAPPAVAGNTATRADTKRPAGPDGAPAPIANPAEAAEAAAEGKPSLWTRLAAAVTPGAPASAKPETKPVARGLAPLGATAPDSRTFVITKDDSPFFSFGPQQATPPDAYLSTGTVVTLNSKNWGWASVQLPDGRVGMVDRAALRPALITDLIPSRQPGDPLMASLSPNQIKPKSTANFVLPAAEMPDLPTSGGAGAMAGNPLLLPFSPDDITEPGQLPPLPEIQPLPEPETPAQQAPAAPSPAPEPADPATAAPDESPPAPEPAPADPAPAAPEPAEPGTAAE